MRLAVSLSRRSRDRQALAGRQGPEPAGSASATPSAARPLDHARPRRVYDRQSDAEVASFVRDLVTTWKRPDSTIHNIQELAPASGPLGTRTEPGARFVGSMWIGSGRVAPAPRVGPACSGIRPKPPVPRTSAGSIWSHRAPTFETIKKHQVSPIYDPSSGSLTFSFPRRPLSHAPLYRSSRWPFSPKTRPHFLRHKRESRDGREFGCIKFRSMRTDAEEIKKRLLAENKNLADGPQFFMDPDPA